MPVELSKIVPWGRSYDEYVSMFALSPTDLMKHFIGCGDGPASFNASLTGRGGSAVSVDPIYIFEAAEIEDRIHEVTPEILALAEANRDTYVWERIPSIEHLRQLRESAMVCFLDDYAAGKAEGRYLAEQLPLLSARDGAFDIALCSHMLFTYTNVMDARFHVEAIEEMCRVARQARIFPLLDMKGQRSSHLDTVLSELKARGLTARVQRVDYEFQRGGNEMLVVEHA